MKKEIKCECNLCHKTIRRKVVNVSVSDNPAEGMYFLHAECYKKQLKVWGTIILIKASK